MLDYNVFNTYLESNDMLYTSNLIHGGNTIPYQLEGTLYDIIILREDTTQLDVIVNCKTIIELGNSTILQNMMLLREMIYQQIPLHQINDYLKSKKCIYLPIRNEIDLDTHIDISKIFYTYSNIRIIMTKPRSQLELLYLRACNDLAKESQQGYSLWVI
jgi:hypothetical protein